MERRSGIRHDKENGPCGRDVEFEVEVLGPSPLEKDVRDWSDLRGGVGERPGL